MLYTRRISRMKITEYMKIDNPTEAFVGERFSYQGLAVHKDIAFASFHTGICAAYDLISKNPAPIGVFKFGSYQKNEPDKRYANHANQGMFTSRYYTESDEFPLLYVTAGNSGESDELGYIGRCTVERISRREGVFTSECVQTIVYNNEGIEATGWQTPGWGWFAHFADTDRGYYYTFSARFRSIIGTGRISLVEDEDERRYGLERIMYKATGRSGWNFDSAALAKTAVFRLRVAELSCKEHK